MQRVDSGIEGALQSATATLPRLPMTVYVPLSAEVSSRALEVSLFQPGGSGSFQWSCGRRGGFLEIWKPRSESGRPPQLDERGKQELIGPDGFYDLQKLLICT